MTAPRRLRLALDQNFPVPLLSTVSDYLPEQVEIRSLRQIDPRLSELDDRPLLIALTQLGWDGLITNNYKMLEVPTEIAAIVKTKAVVIAIEGLGHDPLRAVGALLLELPGLTDRLRPRTSNVLRLRYPQRSAEDAWGYFQSAARRLGREPGELWKEVGVSDTELSGRVLPLHDDSAG